MKANILPQDRVLRVTLLTETNVGPAGTTLRVYHDDRGWHGVKTTTGVRYELFAAHLRNPELCRVEEINACVT